MAPFSPEFNMAAHVFVLTDSILSITSQCCWDITLSSDRLDENISINPLLCDLGPLSPLWPFVGFPDGVGGKESACQCRRHGFDPRVRKIPWRRKWQPTPVFMPGKSHGQSLVGHRPWGCKRVRCNWATNQQQVT